MYNTVCDVLLYYLVYIFLSYIHFIANCTILRPFDGKITCQFRTHNHEMFGYRKCSGTTRTWDNAQIFSVESHSLYMPILQPLMVYQCVLVQKLWLHTNLHPVLSSRCPRHLRSSLPGSLRSQFSQVRPVNGRQHHLHLETDCFTRCQITKETCLEVWHQIYTYHWHSLAPYAASFLGQYQSNHNKNDKNGSFKLGHVRFPFLPCY